MADAPKFRHRGQVKEFMTSGGTTYLVMKFPDSSIAVLRRVRGRGTKGATAQYVPLKGTSQKEVLRRLGAMEGTTYQMGTDLLE